MRKFHYTYITINLINGKQYVGDRSCDCEIRSDLYLGSGSYLKNALKKYGLKNFSKKILELFETKQEAYNAQEKYINKYNTLIPNGYNINPKGGLGIPKSFHNEETKKKIGIGNKGKDGKEIREFNRKNKKNKSYEEQMIYSYGIEIGVIKAQEYRNKIKINTSGKNNPMFEKGFKLLKTKNGMFNKSHSEKTIKKMSKPRSQEGKNNIKIAQQKRREREKLEKHGN